MAIHTFALVKAGVVVNLAVVDDAVPHSDWLTAMSAAYDTVADVTTLNLALGVVGEIAIGWTETLGLFSPPVL